MGLSPLLVSVAVVALGAVVYWRLPEGRRDACLAVVGALALAPHAPFAVVGVLAATVALWTWMGDAPTRAAAISAGAALVAVLAGWKVAAGLDAGGSVIVPLGLSFITFRLLDWVIQRRRGALPAQPLSTLLGWILMPWAFSAGPIEKLDHHQRHRTHAWSRTLAVEGATRIAAGLGKKLVLADGVIAQLQRSVGTPPGDVVRLLHTYELTTADAWVFAALSFLHLYLDFSAYSDLAIGTGRLFGLRLTENFRWPLLARSPADFWRRWHVSLAEWCRGHVYMPMLGLTRSPTLAVLATFLVMGLWHAPSLPWVLWGLWHGGVLALGLRWRKARRGKAPLPAWTVAIAVPATVAYATLGHALAALHAAGGPWAGLALLVRMVGLYLPWRAGV